MSKPVPETVITHEDTRQPAAVGGHSVVVGRDKPLRLDCGVTLAGVTIAYQTYGALNADRSNAILVAHALTGDQFPARDGGDGKPGWWEVMVGPGRPLDTERYFVVCINVLGGCMGSTGPKEVNPATGRPWGLDFPVITIADMVRAQAMVLDHLGIDQLFCVIGGSMGGMQVLQWAVSYPERVFAARKRAHLETMLAALADDGCPLETQSVQCADVYPDCSSDIGSDVYSDCSSDIGAHVNSDVNAHVSADECHFSAHVSSDISAHDCSSDISADGSADISTDERPNAETVP